MPQMTFAQIGTLYNAISNQLEGGVSPQNKQVLLNQVATVQNQIQGLINSGTFNGFTDPNTGNPTIVHAQNIADQMSFLSQQINTFGQNALTPQHSKFINDVVRDVQDIVAGDANLAGLANQNGHMGFKQVSNLLTPPAPFPDTPVQTATLNKFVADSNHLAMSAVTAINDPAFNPMSPATQALIGQIQTFTNNANAYVNDAAQAGVFSARFQNEFASHGVQGTASQDLINGLMNHDPQLVKGAASVLQANANDVTGNMLQSGQNFTPVANFGIPNVVDSVHTAGQVYDDAVTKLIGGVDSVNKAGVLADLHATQTGLQHVINGAAVPATELQHLTQLVSLLGHQSGLVAGIDTANPTPVSQVNAQIHNDTTQILNIVNHDSNLTQAAGGTFQPLPPTGGAHGPLVAGADAPGQTGSNVHMVGGPAVADPGAIHTASSTPAPAPIPPMPIPPVPPASAPALGIHTLPGLTDTGMHTVQHHIFIHDHLV